MRTSARDLAGTDRIAYHLAKERLKLRRALKDCGLLLASSVLTDPIWTEKQQRERRRILSYLPGLMGRKEAGG